MRSHFKRRMILLYNTLNSEGKVKSKAEMAKLLDIEAGYFRNILNSNNLLNVPSDKLMKKTITKFGLDENYFLLTKNSGKYQLLVQQLSENNNEKDEIIKVLRHENAQLLQEKILSLEKSLRQSLKK